MRKAVNNLAHLSYETGKNFPRVFNKHFVWFAKLTLLFLTIIWLNGTQLKAQGVSGGWDAASTTATSGYANRGNGVIQLLDANANGCQGAAVHETSVPYNPSSGSFSHCYKVFFGCPGDDEIGSDTKGDGMAFSFWRNSASYNINNGLACGGGLGYMGSASDGKMITIEFDTWNSRGSNNFDNLFGGGSTGNNDEISVHFDGIASDDGRITSVDAGNLEDGLEHLICIAYTPGTHILSVSMDGNILLSYDMGPTYNLETYFGNVGLNQTWSSGKAGATNPATVTDVATTSISANLGGIPLCPASVVITSPANGNVFGTCEGPINITAAVTPPAGNTVNFLEFFVNGVSIGTSSAAPYGITWSDLTNGNHTITAVAHYSPSNTTIISDIVSITVGGGMNLTTTPPVINGTPEALWNNFAAISLTQGFNTNPDLSATYKATYDANNIYLLVDVTDDVLNTSGAAAWEKDGVEIYIDMGNDKNINYGLNDFQYNFIYNSATVIENKHNATGGVTFGTANKAGGYTMEIQIPWAALGGAPSAGTYIGFDVKINDDDNGGTRDNELSLHDGTFGAWNNPSLFGELKVTGCSTCATITLTAGSNSPQCAGGTINLTASAIVGASYSWTGPNSFTSSSQNPSITNATIAMSGIYSVTATVSGCTSNPITTTVTVNPLPTPAIQESGATTFCQGGSVTLSTTTPYTSYAWSPGGATTASINATASGSYSVTVRDANTCEGTATTPISVTVNSLPTPVIQASGATTFCQGGSVTLSTTTPYTSYAWSPGGATTSSINATASGSYSVTVRDANTCQGTATTPISVTVHPLPTPVIQTSGATTFCQGGSVTLSTTTPYTSYAWSPGGATTSSINATASGSYSVTVRDANTCQGTATTPISVTVHPLPTPVIQASGPTTFCQGGSVTLSTTTPYTSYAWSPGGATTASINATASGSYSVTVRDANTCQGTATTPISVTVNPLPTPVIQASGATTFCQGGSVTLSTATPYTSYDWSPGGATTASINATASGSYSVTVRDVNTCQGTATTPINVNVGPDLQPDFSGPLEVCEGSTGVSYVVINPSSESSFTWTATGSVTINGSTDKPEVLISVGSTGGSLILEENTNTCNGQKNKTISINPNPKLIGVSEDVEVCEGANVTLEASATGGTGAYDFVWTPAIGVTPSNGRGASITATPTSNQIFTVSIFDEKGCSDASQDVHVTISPATPLASIADGDRSICNGPINLAGNDPGIPGITGSWSSNSSSVVFESNDANTSASGFTDLTTIITWTLKGKCSEQSDDIKVVLTTSSLDVDVVAAQDTLCLGMPADLSVVVNGSTASPYKYTWMSSDLSFSTVTSNSSVTVNPTSSGWTKYVVIVEDANGCKSNGIEYDSVYTIAKQDLVVPNLITPNGDDKNDCLIIRDVNEFDIIPGSQIIMFNRWGQEVYTNNHYKNGDFCGASLADGVYYYSLKTSCDQREIKGWLHVISNEASNK